MEQFSLNLKLPKKVNIYVAYKIYMPMARHHFLKLANTSLGILFA